MSDIVVCNNSQILIFEDAKLTYSLNLDDFKTSIINGMSRASGASKNTLNVAIIYYVKNRWFLISHFKDNYLLDLDSINSKNTDLDNKDGEYIINDIKILKYNTEFNIYNSKPGGGAFIIRNQDKFQVLTFNDDKSIKITNIKYDSAYQILFPVSSNFNIDDILINLYERGEYVWKYINSDKKLKINANISYYNIENKYFISNDNYKIYINDINGKTIKTLDHEMLDVDFMYRPQLLPRITADIPIIYVITTDGSKFVIALIFEYDDFNNLNYNLSYIKYDIKDPIARLIDGDIFGFIYITHKNEMWYHDNSNNEDILLSRFTNNMSNAALTSIRRLQSLYKEELNNMTLPPLQNEIVSYLV